MTSEREDWVGLILGDYLVVEGPFKDRQRHNRYRCINQRTGKVAGVTSRDLFKIRKRMTAEGIAPERVGIWPLAEALNKVAEDTKRRQMIANAPAFD